MSNKKRIPVKGVIGIAIIVIIGGIALTFMIVKGSFPKKFDLMIIVEDIETQERITDVKITPDDLLSIPEKFTDEQGTYTIKNINRSKFDFIWDRTFPFFTCRFNFKASFTHKSYNDTTNNFHLKLYPKKNQYTVIQELERKKITIKASLIKDGEGIPSFAGDSITVISIVDTTVGFLDIEEKCSIKIPIPIDKARNITVFFNTMGIAKDTIIFPEQLECIIPPFIVKSYDVLLTFTRGKNPLDSVKVDFHHSRQITTQNGILQYDNIIKSPGQQDSLSYWEDRFPLKYVDLINYENKTPIPRSYSLKYCFPVEITVINDQKSTIMNAKIKLNSSGSRFLTSDYKESKEILTNSSGRYSGYIVDNNNISSIDVTVSAANHYDARVKIQKSDKLDFKSTNVLSRKYKLKIKCFDKDSKKPVKNVKLSFNADGEIDNGSTDINGQDVLQVSNSYLGKLDLSFRSFTNTVYIAAAFPEADTSFYITVDPPTRDLTLKIIGEDWNGNQRSNYFVPGELIVNRTYARNGKYSVLNKDTQDGILSNLPLPEEELELIFNPADNALSPEINGLTSGYKQETFKLDPSKIARANQEIFSLSLIRIDRLTVFSNLYNSAKGNMKESNLRKILSLTTLVDQNHPDYILCTYYSALANIGLRNFTSAQNDLIYIMKKQNYGQPYFREAVDNFIRCFDPTKCDAETRGLVVQCLEIIKRNVSDRDKSYYNNKIIEWR